MVCRAVDDLLQRVASDHIRVVDQDRPEVDEDEETEVELPVEREEIDEEVVGDRLGVAVKRMEGVRREGRRDCARHNQYTAKQADVAQEAAMTDTH